MLEFSLIIIWDPEEAPPGNGGMTILAIFRRTWCWCREINTISSRHDDVMTRELCRDTIRTSTYMALFGPPPLEGPQISRQDQMYRWNPTRGNPQNILIKWANSPFLVIFKLSNVVLSIKIVMLSILKKSKFISEVYNALNIFKIKKNQSYFSLNFFRSTNSVRLLYRTFHSSQFSFAAG